MSYQSLLKFYPTLLSIAYVLSSSSLVVLSYVLDYVDSAKAKSGCSLFVSDCLGVCCVLCCVEKTIPTPKGRYIDYSSVALYICALWM